MLGPASPRVGAGRTARASAEVWTLTVLAHSVAGGGLPSLPWVVGVAGLVAVATVWVLRGSVRLAVMLPVLVSCQLGLHEVLAGLSPPGQTQAGHHHAHHAASTSSWWMQELTPRMVLAHVLCAALTGVVWWVRRSVVDAVLTLARGVALCTWGRSGVASGRTARLGAGRLWLAADPGRAPPRVAAPA